MAQSKIIPLDAAASARDMSDGRRQRSERSRAQIIEAMFDLIREGDMSPSAAKVAERAQVGLRTVFRHFEDMDSLYVEMAERITSEVMPKVLAPFEAGDWRGRLFEHVERRIEIYEYILPVRVSANLRRFQSRFLMDGYRRFLVMERAGLRAILPPEIASDRAKFAALEAAASFQTWRRLRQDQNLPPETAGEVMLFMARRLAAP